MKKIIHLVSTAVVAASVTATPLLMTQAQAADYPNRPVKFVVPWPAGDLEDILTRMVAEDMAKETGKPASVVNKPGGAGVVGAADVSRARADGLTIGSFVADILTTHVLAGNAPFNEETFEPVGIFLDYPFVIATKADAPYNTMGELAEYSQNNAVSLGHFGYQALPTAITFKAADKIGIKFSSDAPFDSNDCSTLANGDADVINTTTQQIIACLKSGDVKLLSAITRDRLTIAPEVPTLNEQTGVSQTTWNGLFVKQGTSPEIKARIAEIAAKTMASDRAQELAKTTGAGVFWIAGADAEQVVSDDYDAAQDLLDFMKQ